MCGDCLSDLADQLHRVRALTEELDVKLARCARLGGDDSGATARSAEKPLPFDWAASEAIFHLEFTLATWARAVATVNGIAVTAPPVYPVKDPSDPARVHRARAASVGTASWLAEHVHLVGTFADAADLLDEVHYALSGGWRAVDRPPETRFAGPCGAEILDEDGEATICEEDLRARPHAEVVVCRACGQEHDMARRYAWLLDAAQDQLLTAAEASRALPALMGVAFSAGGLRAYAHRGRITQHPPQYPKGPPLYRVGDLVDALIADQADAAIQKRGRRRAG